MKTISTPPEELLRQIANIERMEPGKLCVIKQSKNGPFYNLQWREDGKPVSRYVPREQVELVEQNTANHRTFRALVEEYAQQIILRTRENRLAVEKKRKRKISVSNKKKRFRG